MNRLHTTALALMLTAAASATLGADIIEQILVRVNGEIITKSDLEQRQIAALRQRPEVAGLRGDDAALAKVLSEVTPQVIVDAVDELLLTQRGKELGYAMGDDQFKSIVDNIRKENKIETDEQFAQALQGEGMTMLDLRRQLEKQMLVSRVQQTEVMGKLSVTDEEVLAYYEQHKAEFSTTPQVTLREILVTVAGVEGTVNVAADEAARDKAEDIHKRLLAGEPFARLAADSSDAASKANGGLLGEIPWEDVSPELQKDLNAMKAGDVTRVLRTPRGYQILKMDARTDGSVKPLAEAREAVSEKVFEGKRKGEFQRYLVKLRAQGIIEWKNDEVKKAWEAGVAALPTEAEAAKPGR